MSRLILSVFFSVSMIAPSAFAASGNCGRILAGAEGLVSQTFLEIQLKQFSRLSPAVQNRLGPNNVAAVLADPANPLTRQDLVYLLNRLRPSSTVTDLKRELKAELKWRVPDRQIQSRIEKLKEDDPASLRRALGYKTLSEVQELVYGRNPLRLSRDSLLGRYLAKTHAAHLRRRYPRGPKKREGMGGLKLTVALGREHRRLFLEYFNFPEIMMHYHTPAQGTLLLFFNGEKISYAGSSYSDLDRTSFTQKGMLLPFILLSSAEANRMANYVQLARLNRNFAKLPWTLPGYCAVGGYDSCTHWFGEIPIGDDLVSEYTFPGRVDEHATNSGMQGNSRAPQHARLKPYWKSPAYEQMLSAAAMNPTNLNYAYLDPCFMDTPGMMTPQRYRFVLDHLTRLVWQVPGFQQLGDTLGEKRAKLRGEFANPGYVAHVLTGRISNDRVPVVFYVQQDDRTLDRDLELYIQAY